VPTPALPLPPPAHLAPLPPELATPGGTRIRLGAAYAAIPGIRPLELDLYLPAARPAPVVVFLHGGGWRVGSRRSGGPAFPGGALFEAAARAGLAVASVDYRLSAEAVWPAQLHDVKAAVRWLRSRSGELGIDPDRVAVWGESAGGHLAALLGLTNGDEALEGDVGVTGPSSAVTAVAAWYPPTDLPGMAADLGTDPLDATTREAQLLGGAVPSVPDAAAQASPVTRVTPDAPPFLLLHGADDSMVPCVQSERLHAALVEAGVEAELVLYPGADHMWLGAPEAAQSALDHTIDVLRRRLGVRR
jgi:acetyl esterase/lipase